MSILKWEKDETVAILTMTNGENRHNPEFIEAFLAAMDEIEKDASIYSVVLTSDDPKNWSLGIDLEWIMGAANSGEFEAVKQFMYGLNRIFTRILLFPMPVIAAINGHAFGDGVMLACVCDFRFMKSDRGYFCMPEVDIDIPLLPAMQAIVEKAMPFYKFNELMLTGKRATAPELAEHHILVKACANQEELMADAVAFARTFTKKRAIFGEMKKRMNKYILEIMEKEDPEFIDSGTLMV